MSPEARRLILHDLNLHQIDLEMQNEELRASQSAPDILLARYFDLFDLPPVGYRTLSKQGLIFEANLSAATMVGEAQDMLVGRPLARFIFGEDADAYHQYLNKFAKADRPQVPA